MLTAPQTIVNIIVSRRRVLSLARVEHDEAVDGVEGEAERPERVASEDDGRALLRAHEQVGRHAAQHERADAHRRRAQAAGVHFPAREVARAAPAPAFGLNYPESPGGRLVHGEAETGARVEQRTPAFGEHDEGAARAAFGEPGHDRAFARGAARAERLCARVEEAEFARGDVYDKAEGVEGFGRVEDAVHAFGQPGRDDEEAARGQPVLARAERERADESLLRAARARAAQTADDDAAPACFDFNPRFTRRSG